MSDLPFALDPPLGAQLAAVMDLEGKVPRALAALAPLADRAVALVGGGEERLRQLRELGAQVVPVDWDGPARLPLADASVDAVVGWWSVFRGVDPDELAEVDRALRPGGRLLVVHDYGRDDVSRLRGDQPEYGSWGRRDGPFLTGGFRIRVLHCWWTFPDLPAARTLLTAAFGTAGETVAAGLSRPRLSWNVAVYHRSRREEAGAEPSSAAGSEALPGLR